VEARLDAACGVVGILLSRSSETIACNLADFAGIMSGKGGVSPAIDLHKMRLYLIDASVWAMLPFDETARNRDRAACIVAMNEDHLLFFPHPPKPFSR